MIIIGQIATEHSAVSIFDYSAGPMREGGWGEGAIAPPPPPLFFQVLIF